MPDIETRDDCERLVRAFYGRALEDPMIGFIFVDVAKLDLEAHVPRITSFWETVLLGAQSYGGGAFRPHAALHARAGCARGHFERWLALWPPPSTSCSPASAPTGEGPRRAGGRRLQPAPAPWRHDGAGGGAGRTGPPGHPPVQAARFVTNASRKRQKPPVKAAGIGGGLSNAGYACLIRPTLVSRGRASRDAMGQRHHCRPSSMRLFAAA